MQKYPHNCSIFFKNAPIGILNRNIYTRAHTHTHTILLLHTGRVLTELQMEKGNNTLTWRSAKCPHRDKVSSHQWYFGLTSCSLGSSQTFTRNITGSISDVDCCTGGPVIGCVNWLCAMLGLSPKIPISQPWKGENMVCLTHTASYVRAPKEPAPLGQPVSCNHILNSTSGGSLCRLRILPL